jgi:Cu/Ag efflux protein CusF
MKRSVVMIVVLVMASFFLVSVAPAAEKSKMETATGKVTAIDPQGKAITISAKAGKEAMDVGTIVDKDTMVKVKGKAATLNDIKVGDTVTIRYLRSDNLYAKEIIKK